MRCCCRDLLELLADSQRSFSNDFRRNFRRRRQADAVDVALSESGHVERRFAKRLCRRTAGGCHRAAGLVPLDDQRSMAEECRQLGRAFPRGTGADRDQIVRVGHW